MRRLFILNLVLWGFVANAQTIGGHAVYNFLKLPATTLLTATGGVNTSYMTDDAGLAANNPALLRPELHHHIDLAFNGLPADIKAYALTGVHHVDKYGTTFGAHIYFLNYGATPQTDASGNQMGEFRPTDFVAQISAGRAYEERWRYGASLKFISSNYGQYRSSGLAVDVGVHYADSANGFSAGLLAKNMGVQLSTYAGEREDLPFDLQIGVTKRLAKSPFGFSLTAQHLQRFDILYNDTTFNNDNNFSVNDGFFNKLLNHFVLATHIYAGRHLEATIGYNRLRRSELNIGTTGNGLNGFSLGLRMKFQKLQVLYSRANYQKNVAYNQLGLSIHLDKLLNKDL